MKGKTYRTRYTSIVKKGTVGKCLDVINAYVYVLNIEFANGESFWFIYRDLIEVE